MILPTREPFSLERFDDTKIRQQLLQVLSDNSKAEDEVEKTIEIEQKLLISRAKGLLPYSDIGDNDFDNQRQIMHAFVQKIPEQHKRAEPVTEQPFLLTINDFEVSGMLDYLNANKQRILIQPTQAYSKDYISLWFYHLVLNTLIGEKKSSSDNLTEISHTSHFYSPELSFSLPPIDRDEAKQLLQQLLDYYWQGLHFPLNFFAKPALKMIQKDAENSSIKVAIDSWENNYFGAPEKDKFEHWLLYRGLDNNQLFNDEFIAISWLLFARMFQTMQ